MLKIDGRIIGKNYPIYIIAEIGINHNGNLNLCKKLILEAKKCGADAVKLQIVFPEYSYCKNTLSYKLFKKNNLGLKQLKEIKNFAKKIGITLFATPGDFQSLEIIKKLKFPAIKISSSSITNTPLIQKAADLKLPILFSTGMAYFREIKKIVKLLKSRGTKNFAILKCTSLYPSPPKSINLRSIKKLKQFNVPVGFSDHTNNNDASIAAASIGVHIIEKHFTINKILNVPDKKISADPKEFKSLVNSIRNIEKLLGKIDSFPDTLEIRERKKNHRKIVSVKKITKDEIFSFQNLALKRTIKRYSGLEPNLISKIIGKKSKKNISADTIITFKHFLS